MYQGGQLQADRPGPEGGYMAGRALQGDTTHSSPVPGLPGPASLYLPSAFKRARWVGITLPAPPTHTAPGSTPPSHTELMHVTAVLGVTGSMHIWLF